MRFGDAGSGASSASSPDGSVTTPTDGRATTPPGDGLPRTFTLEVDPARGLPAARTIDAIMRLRRAGLSVLTAKRLVERCVAEGPQTWTVRTKPGWGSLTLLECDLRASGFLLTIPDDLLREREAIFRVMGARRGASLARLADAHLLEILTAPGTDVTDLPEDAFLALIAASHIGPGAADGDA